jgi:hypothetical protein
MAEAVLDALPPTPRCSAEWSHSHLPEPEQDPDLVILLMYENHMNLVALEEALEARREELSWAGDVADG